METIENQYVNYIGNGGNVIRRQKEIYIVDYQDEKLAILNETKNDRFPYILKKDPEGNYWDLGLLPIEIKCFQPSRSDEFNHINYKNYRDETLPKIKIFNNELKGFFDDKIKTESYFNKVEFEYIGKFHSEILESAMLSKEKCLENREKAKKEENKAREEEKIRTVKDINDKFKKELELTKRMIASGELVELNDFVFYKDDNYDNGETYQNNFLYLAKQYNIKIPLATQGFINNRLLEYNFATHEGSFDNRKNNKNSQKMFEYLDLIYVKVKEELESSKEKTVSKKEEHEEIEKD